MLKQSVVFPILLLVAGLLILPFALSAQDMPRNTGLRDDLPRDAYGNLVQSPEGHRLNYTNGPDEFLRIEVDAVGRQLATQVLPTNPFAETQIKVEFVPQTTPFPESFPNSQYLAEKWKTGIWGTGIGGSKITAQDIDHDGAQEIVLGGGGGFGSNYFWYIVSYAPTAGTYQQEWLSKDYTMTSIRRLAVADAQGDGTYEIYVALNDGSVEIYDAETRSLLHTLPTVVSTLYSMVIADADGDGEQEIVVCGGSQIAVYHAATYQLEWQTGSYGGGDIAVADVDADPAPEIVTTQYVIDGVSHALEWDYASNFGSILQLADIDSDDMAEIVAAESWYWLRAFDVDTQSQKWELPADLDIQALRVGDIDDDGVQEVLYGDGQWGQIHCHDSVTLVEEWYIANPEHGVTDVAYGDVDGDGTVEVLWGAGWTSTGPDYLFVGDWTTQSIEWQSLDIGGPLTALDVADVDNDGVQEIVMVSFESDSGYDDGIIFVYDAETYELEWRSDPVLGGSAWTGVHALKIANVDDDDALEIMIATADLYDGLILAYDGATHDLEWQTDQFDGASMYSLAVGDVDNDGDIEVIGGQRREHTGAEGVYVRVFDGSTGAQEWHTFDLGYWVGVYNIDIADSDDDGNPELAFSVAGDVHVYDGVTQSQDWQSSLGDARSVAVFDVDDDGHQEIVIGTNSGQLVAFDGQTYAQEWSESVSGTGINSLKLADMNRDTDQEIVLSDNEYLHVVDAATRDPIWQSERLGHSAGNGGHLVVGDIDDDTRDEVVVGSSYALYVFTYDLMPFGSGKGVDLSFATPGDQLSYTIELVNFADHSLAMTMTDVLPDHTSYVAGSLSASDGSWGITGETIDWSVEPGASERITLTFSVTIEPSTADGTEVINTAVFSGGGFLDSRDASTLVDALPPESSIDYPAEGEIVSGSSYEIGGTVADTVSGVDRVEVCIGDEPCNKVSGTLSWTYNWTPPMTDSLYEIQARATDRVGHQEDPGASVTVLVDNLPPRIEYTIPEHGRFDAFVDSPVIVSFSEPVLSDTLEFSCQPDPGGWTVQSNDGGQQLLLAHIPFDSNTMYSCVIYQVQDRANHDLVAGTAPNPWSFVTGGEATRIYLPVSLREFSVH